jgi:hypothetical protein
MRKIYHFINLLWYHSKLRDKRNPYIFFYNKTWTILSNIYAKSSHGLIKQVKSQLKKITKEFDNTIKFLQAIKARAGKLILFGAPFDAKDLTKKILDGLGDKYKKLICVV